MATVVGIIFGILLTAIIFDESLKVTISYQYVQLKIGDKVETIEKKEVLVIYIENKRLIILGENSNELYRKAIETKSESVCEVFQQYHYPWVDKDPYENQYQSWVLGHPDFSEKINALLHSREIALRNDKKKDAKHFQEDSAKVGIIIKDERNGQYVRFANNPH